MSASIGNAPAGSVGPSANSASVDTPATATPVNPPATGVVHRPSDDAQTTPKTRAKADVTDADMQSPLHPTSDANGFAEGGWKAGIVQPGAAKRLQEQDTRSREKLNDEHEKIHASETRHEDKYVQARSTVQRGEVKSSDAKVASRTAAEAARKATDNAKSGVAAYKERQAGASGFENIEKVPARSALQHLESRAPKTTAAGNTKLPHDPRMNPAVGAVRFATTPNGLRTITPTVAKNTSTVPPSENVFPHTAMPLAKKIGPAGHHEVTTPETHGADTVASDTGKSESSEHAKDATTRAAGTNQVAANQNAVRGVSASATGAVYATTAGARASDATAIERRTARGGSTATVGKAAAGAAKSTAASETGNAALASNVANQSRLDDGVHRAVGGAVGKIHDDDAHGAASTDAPETPSTLAAGAPKIFTQDHDVATHAAALGAMAGLRNLIASRPDGMRFASYNIAQATFDMTPAPLSGRTSGKEEHVQQIAVGMISGDPYNTKAVRG